MSYLAVKSLSDIENANNPSDPWISLFVDAIVHDALESVWLEDFKCYKISIRIKILPSNFDL